MKAIWKKQILAESNNTIVVEKNHYFPPSSLKIDFFVPTSTTTHCPWKGDASYYSIVVENEENKDAAWYYPLPKDAAIQIKDHVAFWRGVTIEDN